jgi:hypothetical protein
MPKFASLAFAIWCLSHAAAFAWGGEGHHIVARIAADELTPKAKAAVADLLGGDATASLIQASTWADEIRPGRPETAPWHYVDIEITGTGYDAARDCRNDDCVVAQVERDAKIVGDQGISKPVRAEALRFLIHFVGDIHQPLHCSDNNDRGGISVRVVLEGHRTNLHAIWDTPVVQALGSSEDEVTAGLERGITQADRIAWSRGSAVDWSNETFGIAKDSVYRGIQGRGGNYAPLILPSDYANGQRAIVTMQLERAGVRLAALLNRHLG